MFKSRQFIIGIIISLIFFAFALVDIDLSKVWTAFTQANYLALIPALLIYFVGVWIRAIRWRILLRPILPAKADSSVKSIYHVVVIGYMGNNVLPARIGELVRAFVLSLRTGVRKTATLATILVERIFDGLIMIGFGAAAILIVLIVDSDALMTGEGHRLGNFLTSLSIPLTIGAVVFLGALVAFLVVASSPDIMRKVANFGFRFLPKGLHKRGDRLLDSFISGLAALRSPSNTAAVFGLTILAWLCETGMYFIIGYWGFDLRGTDGLPLPFYVYLLATAAVNLGTLIPQAPGYAGVFEAIAKAVLVGAFGVEQNASLSYVLVLHATLLIPVTLLGFYYMARESISYSQLVNLEETRAQASQQAHELEGPFTDIELVQDGKITQGDTTAEDLLEMAGEEKITQPKP